MVVVNVEESVVAGCVGASVDVVAAAVVVVVAAFVVVGRVCASVVDEKRAEFRTQLQLGHPSLSTVGTDVAPSLQLGVE